MTLSRRGALGLIGAAPLIRPAVAKTRFAYALSLTAIADGVWMLEGATEYFSETNGGAIVNLAVLQGATGLILVDTGPSLKYGQALLSALSTLDPRGVSAVVNTHIHPDHFFGNQAFAGVPIYALDKTIAGVRRDGDALSDNMYRLLGDWMRGTEVVAPNRVIAGGETVLDGRPVRILALDGHTDADLAVLDSRTGTVIAGDLLFYDRAPTTPSADIRRWQVALTVLEDLRAARLVPGHGPLDLTGASIAQTRDYLTWLDTTLRRAARSGQTMVEIMDFDLPAKYAAMGAQPEEFRRSVSHLFPAIEVEELPRAN